MTSFITVLIDCAAAFASYVFANDIALCPSAIKLNACAFCTFPIRIADGTNANANIPNDTVANAVA